MRPSMIAMRSSALGASQQRAARPAALALSAALPTAVACGARACSTLAAVAARNHRSCFARKCACASCVIAGGRSAPAAAAATRAFASQPARPARSAPASAPAAAGRRPTNGAPQSAAVRTPTLNAVLKRFNLLVHPDMFGSAPAHATANQQSLQALNSLLSTLKTRDTKDLYPPKQHLQLVFHVKKRRGDEKWAEYVRTHDLDTHLAAKSASPHLRGKGQGGRNGQAGGSGGRGAPVNRLPARGTEVLEGEFFIVPAVVSTNGGHCKRLVQAQLAGLFYRCGLPHVFEWDEEYWKMGGERNRKDIVEEEERARKAEEAADREENAY